jgi:hypothetical protein
VVYILKKIPGTSPIYGPGKLTPSGVALPFPVRSTLTHVT